MEGGGKARDPSVPHAVCWGYKGPRESRRAQAANTPRFSFERALGASSSIWTFWLNRRFRAMPLFIRVLAFNVVVIGIVRVLTSQT